jgi:hypothetical protein
MARGAEFVRGSRAGLRRALAFGAALAVGLAAGGVIGLLAQVRPRERLPAPSPPPGVLNAGPAPSVAPAEASTLLLWTPGGLPQGFARAATALPGVAHVAVVTSGIAWLTRSSADDGTVVDQPPAGLAIPLEVAGVNLSGYEPFLAPADRAILPSLAAGEAALGTTSAAIRRLGPGGMLQFGSTQLSVAGILPDAEIGANEVFVSRATAAKLGVTIERYALIEPAPGASRGSLTAALKALLPQGTQARIRGPGETPVFRQGDAVLPPVEMKEFFGEFAAKPAGRGLLRIDPAWVATHIVQVEVPLLGEVRCNRALIPQLTGALQDVERAGLGSLIHPNDYGGCYSPRFISEDPLIGISHHTWGAAIDINVSQNRFGRTPRQDPRIVKIFEQWGFAWGGDWLIPDGMHFEFVRFATGT